ncbi:calmodulin-4-like isoform X2 [Mytilus edulis]|uniref:calmodulin-4-like isoform X2 n=1 Tax=Mytilus edulis TaxID=6550 RepID=UPI0039EECE56
MDVHRLSAKLNDVSASEDGFIRYLKGEFAAMDTAKHGTLSLLQFEKLLTFLGYDGEMKPETIFEKGNVDLKEGITVEEYCKTMSKFPDVKNRTNRLRALFLKFDHSNDGFAPKKDVVEEIRKMGVDIDKEILTKVDNMDVNKDGKISYQEYMYTSLKEKQYI